MIESTSMHTGRSTIDQTIFTFCFPCPSCRADVEFPVRMPPPWDMKRVAQEAVKKEFKTNFQIKNQLDIISTKIKQGCQEHQGEIKMWFCKACKAILCQFCVLQDHNSGDHDVTLLNLAQKKQAIKTVKGLVEKQVTDLESNFKRMEGQLADIHRTKGSCEEEKKQIMDEFMAVRIKLDSMASEVFASQESFLQQLTSKEMRILQVYQEAAEDLEHYKAKVDELDQKLADADQGIDSPLLDDDETLTETYLKPNAIPVIELPERPEISLDQLQHGMQKVQDILSGIRNELEHSYVDVESNSSTRNEVSTHNIIKQFTKQLKNTPIFIES